MADRPHPYDGMTDEQVLERAKIALVRVNSYPLDSVQRSVQWAVYEQAKAELDMRFYRHVLGRLRERGDL